METFVWNEHFITGEAQVDAEHQELVRIINWIIGHQKSAAEKMELGKVLDDLVQYAATHFTHETELMVAGGCDPRFLRTHVAVHQDFADKVIKLRESPVTQDDIEHLLRFLSGWLAHHILGMDQSMARQLRRIREGMAPAEAYDLELQVPHDPGTESLLEAMGALYRLIASRNEALEQLNANLEEQVQFRTRELTTSNEQLKVEQNSLHLAMQQLEMTQRKLLESEHRRAAATRRNMESMLAQIIDNDPVPTFVIDAQHRMSDPANGMKVAEAPLSVLDVRLDEIAAVAHSPVTLVTLGHLGGDEVLVVAADEKAAELVPRLVEQRLLAPDPARFGKGRADGDVRPGQRDDLGCVAHRMPDRPVELPQQVKGRLDPLGALPVAAGRYEE